MVDSTSADFPPLPQSLREQAINILDAYLQRRYVKSSEKEMHFIYLLTAPEHSESTGLSVLSITMEYRAFYAISLGFLSLPFMLA